MFSLYLCHPDERKDPALGLCQAHCEILRVAQNDTATMKRIF